MVDNHRFPLCRLRRLQNGSFLFATRHPWSTRVRNAFFPFPFPRTCLEPRVPHDHLRFSRHAALTLAFLPFLFVCPLPIVTITVAGDIDVGDLPSRHATSLSEAQVAMEPWLEVARRRVRVRNKAKKNVFHRFLCFNSFLSLFCRSSFTRMTSTDPGWPTCRV